MALQLSKTLASGIQLDAAYCKVIHAQMNFLTNYAKLRVATYKDQTSRDNNCQPISVDHYELTTDQYNQFITPTEINPLNINHVSQAYEYLKTLPDYQGALDV